MSLKRKFDVTDDSTPFGFTEDTLRMPKQLKLVPFPNADRDEDILMSEAEPLYHDQVHSRIHSNASTTSSSSGYSPSEASSGSAYPTFELYPSAFGTDSAAQQTSMSSNLGSPVGLIQPKSGFAHHGSGCTTIPRLRVACSTSINGQRRSMYTLCESCGAISIVDCD